MTKQTLVADGAGYVGSHACKALTAAGYAPVSFDNLSNGHDWAVKWVPLVQGAVLSPYAQTKADVETMLARLSSFPIGVAAFRLGGRVGTSVRQVLDAVKHIPGVDFPVKIEARRPGDAPMLAADVSKVRAVLGWTPGFSDLHILVKTALQMAQQSSLGPLSWVR